MKLRRAEFNNFRLLKNLELKFSVDSANNLTVIRAANETGKTTILTALQWALYGDYALPGNSRKYRLHPIDWDVSETNRVPISVTVEFEVRKYRRSQDRIVENIKQYRIVRTATEEIIGKEFNRTPSSVNLYEITERGISPIDFPEAIVNDELPPELREVFFTDGDRALSFIEADATVASKRDRVKKAIRSLLGLEIIEEAIRHVKNSAREINRKAKKIDGGNDLQETADKIENIDIELDNLSQKLLDAKLQFSEFEQKIKEIERKIAAALQKGDKEKLKNELESTGKQIKQLNNRIEAAEKEHANLFKKRSLAIDLLYPVLCKSLGLLENLQDEGKIPNTTIPILEDRLKKQICICGESLDEENLDGKIRREAIKKLINDSKKSDEIQKIITELFFNTKNLFKEDVIEQNRWIDSYRKVLLNRDELDDLRDEAGRKFRSLEAKLDDLPDTDIKSLRETRREYINQKDRFLQKETTLETRINSLNQEKEDLKIKRTKLLKEKNKGEQILSELSVTQDVLTILNGSYDQITNDEVKKVSEYMNNIFLEMIGADPDQGAIIRKAEISDQFDIIVYGPKGRTLNPDRDLNGASRRALTLSFILALTIVSEVEAPNVIDTPLGMMSGFVKRSVLRTAIEKSSQLVLFLTHDEIKGCEEILDDAAGVVSTLTNPTHFPKMLVNDPCVDEKNILICDCNHRTECKLCERRMDKVILEEV